MSLFDIFPPTNFKEFKNLSLVMDLMDSDLGSYLTKLKNNEKILPEMSIKWIVRKILKFAFV